MEIRDLVFSELNPPLNRRLITDEAGLSCVKDFLARTTEFAFDLETNVVDRFIDRKIRTIQLGNRVEQYVIDLLSFAGSSQALHDGQGWRKPAAWTSPVLETIRPALESNSHLKLGVGLDFEYKQLNWCLGLRPWNFYDCDIVEQLIYAGKVPYYHKEWWGMDHMMERYARLRIDKTLQTSFDLETPLTEEQIDYAAFDCRTPFAIRTGQQRHILAMGIQRVVDIENHAIPAFSEMHVVGKRLNPEKWMDYHNAILLEHAENVKELDKHFVPVLGVKEEPDFDLEALEAVWREETDKELRAEYRKEFYAARKAVKEYPKKAEKYEGMAPINYGAPDQVLQALRKMGFTEKKLPDTNDKSLSKFADKPVIQALQKYRSTDKLKDTYGKNWLEYIWPETQRIHANFNQIGTETGRPSCTKPNLFNLPKDKRIRACFDEEGDYVVLTVDMSGAELRIIAELSGDEVWIAAFNNNWDVHSVCAQMMMEEKWNAAAQEGCAFTVSKQKCKCKLHLEMRDGAKAQNFGVAYGKEAYQLAQDLKIPLEEAEKLLKIWRVKFKTVHIYLVNSGNSAKALLKATTLSGRVRWFTAPDWKDCARIAQERAQKDGRAVRPNEVNKIYFSKMGSIEREGKNSPIQGTNADIAKIAMGSGFDKNGKPFMWHLLPQYGASLINFIYDEFVVRVPRVYAQECFDMVGDCIRRAGAELMSKVTMEFEGHIAECWTK